MSLFLLECYGACLFFSLGVFWGYVCLIFRRYFEFLVYVVLGLFVLWCLSMFEIVKIMAEVVSSIVREVNSPV